MLASFPLSFRLHPRPPAAVAPLCPRALAQGAPALARSSSSVLLATFALLQGACAVDSEPLFQRIEPLDTNVSRPGNLPTFESAGSGGRSASGAAADGVRGQAIAGLVGADAGSGIDVAQLSSDAGGDAGAPCLLAAECDDGNECTEDECSAGLCRHVARAAGSACGDPEQNECTQPDSCDGAGSCVAHHAPADTPCGRGASACSAEACDGAGTCQPLNVAAGTPCGDDGGGCSAPVCDGSGLCEARDVPNGAACSGGSCSLGACIAGQAVGCPAELASEVPLQLDWSSAGRSNLIQGSCDDSINTPDFALVFSAPSAGEYRIEAAGAPDAVLAVRAGSCSSGNQLGCNDDFSSGNRDSRLELTLGAGETITIYVSEFGNGSSGAGVLRITLL